MSFFNLLESKKAKDHLLMWDYISERPTFNNVPISVLFNTEPSPQYLLKLYAVHGLISFNKKGQKADQELSVKSGKAQVQSRSDSKAQVPSFSIYIWVS